MKAVPPTIPLAWLADCVSTGATRTGLRVPHIPQFMMQGAFLDTNELSIQIHVLHPLVIGQREMIPSIVLEISRHRPLGAVQHCSKEVPLLINMDKLLVVVSPRLSSRLVDRLSAEDDPASKNTIKRGQETEPRADRDTRCRLNDFFDGHLHATASRRLLLWITSLALEAQRTRLYIVLLGICWSLRWRDDSCLPDLLTTQRREQPRTRMRQLEEGPAQQSTRDLLKDVVW